MHKRLDEIVVVRSMVVVLDILRPVTPEAREVVYLLMDATTIALYLRRQETMDTVCATDEYTAPQKITYW